MTVAETIDLVRRGRPRAPTRAELLALCDAAEEGARHATIDRATLALVEAEAEVERWRERVRRLEERLALARAALDGRP